MRKTVLERFEDKYCPEPNSGCWLWMPVSTNDGYGTFWYQQKNYAAHRASWMIRHSQAVPEGMYVLHRCDTPSCVNPDHMFLGTQCDNIHDMIKKSRANYSGVTGERSHAAKLTRYQVMEIFNAPGPYSEIACKYGVSISHVGNIKTKNKWKHIHDK